MEQYANDIYIPFITAMILFILYKAFPLQLPPFCHPTNSTQAKFYCSLNCSKRLRAYVDIFACSSCFTSIISSHFVIYFDYLNSLLFVCSCFPFHIFYFCFCNKSIHPLTALEVYSETKKVFDIILFLKMENTWFGKNIFDTILVYRHTDVLIYLCIWKCDCYREISLCGAKNSLNVDYKETEYKAFGLKTNLTARSVCGLSIVHMEGILIKKVKRKTIAGFPFFHVPIFRSN